MTDPKPRILAVDDHEENLEILEELLQEEDYDIVTADCGEAALERIAEQRPDVVLLDIMMPGIDGYEVCRRIRASAGGDAIKIILVSAKAMTAERVKGYEKHPEFANLPLDLIPDLPLAFWALGQLDEADPATAALVRGADVRGAVVSTIVLRGGSFFSSVAPCRIFCWARALSPPGDVATTTISLSTFCFNWTSDSNCPSALAEVLAGAAAPLISICEPAVVRPLME